MKINMSIKIKNNPTVESIEQLYAEIEGRTEAIDILLPSITNDLEFGIVSSIIQFVSTWQRSNCAGSLLLNTDGVIEEEVEKLVQEDFIFPSVVMCWDKGIFNSDKTVSLKLIIKPIRDSMFKEMQSLHNLRGFRTLLACFDHLPTQQGLLECFYSGGEFVTSDGVLAFSLNSVIKHVLGFRRDLAVKNVANAFEDLLAIVYELMKNTDDWARTDTNLIPLSPNVRGTYLKFRKGRKSTYKERFKNHKGLENYFDAFEPNSNDEIFFLEVSVFDSGVGFIDKYLNEKKATLLEIEEQVKIVKSCLIRRNTSAKGTERESKGLGLDRIMQILNRRGFFTIRTANTKIYRDMKANPYIDTDKVEQVLIYDWEENSSEKFKRWNPAVGSSITIVYPISNLL